MHTVSRAKKFMRQKGVGYAKRFCMATFAASMVFSSMPLQAIADTIYEPTTIEAATAELVETPVDATETEAGDATTEVAPTEKDVVKVTLDKDGSLVGYYETITEAINNAPDYSTVTMLKDASEYVRISNDSTRDMGGVHVTFDLGGYKLNGITGWTMAVVSNNINLTVQNGTILNTLEQSEGAGDSCAISTNGQYKNVNITLDNLTVEAKDGKATSAAALFFPAQGEYVIKNCTVEGSALAVELRGGNLTVVDSNLKGGTGDFTENENWSGTTATGVAIVAAPYFSDVNVTLKGSGNVVDGDIYSVYMHDPNNTGKVAYATIEGGSFVGMLGTANDGVIEVSGGTFDSDPSAYLAEGLVANHIGDTYQVVAEADGIWTLNGSVSFGNLNDAVAAAGTTASTIVLNQDVESSGVFVEKNQTVTIDLNGHTLTITEPLYGSSGTQSQGFHLEGKKVVIKNGTINAGDSRMLIQNYSNLTLTDVTLDASEASAGKDSAGNAQTYYVVSNCSGSMTVTGETNIIAPEGGVAFDVWYSSSYANGVKATVNTTGTIDGKIEFAGASEGVASDAAAKLSLAITNGTFVNYSIETANIDGTANIKVSGGEFDTDPSTFVVTSLVAKQDTESKMYKLVAGPWSIGETTYANLTVAVANAKAGDTIVLNEDLVTNGLVVNEGVDVTVDLNGHVLTLNSATVGSAGTQTNGFQILKGSKIAFQNGTIECGDTAKVMFQNYGDLTFTDVELDAEECENCLYVISSNNGKVAIKGSTSVIAPEGEHAIDVMYWPENGYGVNDMTIETTGTIDGAISYGSASKNAEAVKNVTLTIDAGEFVNCEFETYNLDDATANIKIAGGTFDIDPTDPVDYVVEGKVVHVADGIWSVLSGHTFADPIYTWSSNNTKVTAILSCTACDHDVAKIQSAQLDSVTLPTTSEFGSYNYKSTFEIEGKEYVATTSTPIAKLQVEESEELSENAAALKESLDALISSENVSEDLKNAVLDCVKNGTSLQIEANVSDIEDLGGEAEAIEAALKANGLTEGVAYDVTIEVLDNDGNVVAELTNLESAVKVELDITDLPEVEDGMTRTYKVIHMHNGEAELVADENVTLSEDGKSIIVSSAKFSTFVVAYSDAETVVEEPGVEVTKVAMHRVYNPNSGEHFYTADETERDNLLDAGWKYEGIAWTAPSTSGTPVYRLYSGTDHHYTMSETERDNLIEAGWKDEGIGWYSADAETGVELYRVYNPNVQPTAAKNNSGSHHYTMSETERDNLVNAGWRNEGTAWYGMAD